MADRERDACVFCTLRGDFKACVTETCSNHDSWYAGSLRLALETATHEKDDALRTVKALTPAANYCLEYKPLLLKAERERDEAVRVLRDIATFGWYAKGAKVARAYLAAREGR